MQDPTHIALCAVITITVSAIKSIFEAFKVEIPREVYSFITIAIAVIMAYFTTGANVITGIMLGLAATGLYENYKNTNVIYKKSQNE